MSSVPTPIQQKLTDQGQEHLLQFWDELSEQQQATLLEQISSIDFDLFNELLDVKNSSDTSSKSETITPCEFVSHDDPAVDWIAIRQEGERVIHRGGLGVLTVAGGQGTRLGWNGPKGTFPAAPVSGKSLFQLIAEQILFASCQYGVTIPWYIMTSKANDESTRSFLLDNNCFGLQRADIFIFPQDLVPAVDEKGKMLLVDRDQMLMSPDGHGGVINALKKGGGLEEMGGRGIEHLSYVQVDNPLVKVVDPVFLGLHCSGPSSGEASSKCVIKTNPDERVGVFCTRGGALNIVEYSDLSTEQANEKNKSGDLTYGCGSIAVHMFSTSFIERVASELLWHVVNKAEQHIDPDTGQQCTSEEQNVYKFERFVFDVLPLASNSIVLETKREEEFAPIKNASGDDSPQTSMQLQNDRAVSWLRSRGVDVPNDALVEISPTTAASPSDLTQEILPERIEPGETVLL